MSLNLADAKNWQSTKNYLTPQIWEDTYLREIFYAARKESGVQ